jgi:hypothetical protein
VFHLSPNTEKWIEKTRPGACRHELLMNLSIVYDCIMYDICISFFLCYHNHHDYETEQSEKQDKDIHCLNVLIMYLKILENILTSINPYCASLGEL